MWVAWRRRGSERDCTAHCGDGEIDRKIGFQGFSSGGSLFSVLCSCRRADYDNRLHSAHRPLNEPIQGQEEVCVRILYAHEQVSEYGSESVLYVTSHMEMSKCDGGLRWPLWRMDGK